MDNINNENLMASTPLAWILINHLVNENQEILEFDNHRFLIDIYADDSDDIVCRKSAQIGYSVLAILKTLWTLKYKKLNVIYALPTKNVVNDFVKPKVNPLIASNPVIASSVSDDSVSLKKVGDRFVYFKGGFSDREAISISGDLLVIDEYDRMPDMGVVNTFDSRLQASKHPMRWRFSNPSQVGFGVDQLYNESDMRHWFIKCEHCGHDWFIDWETDGKCHYVNRELKMFACGKCGKEISDESRRMGRWVAKYPNRKRHGYWISQMMAPWVTAERIIEQYEESGIEFFYNFVLGKAYTPSDMIVDRTAILRACAPSNISKRAVVIGVDQNVNNQIWVAGTVDGIFAYGKYESWEEVERMKLMYNSCIVVCDPNPYPTKPKQMAEKYSNWYMCYFRPQDGMHIVKWNGQVVYADRTRLLDMVASEINEAKLLFRQRPSELEAYIEDWGNIYRTTTEDDKGHTRSEWIKKEGKNSDYSFATAYYRIGLSKLLGGESMFLEPGQEKSTIIGDTGIGNAVADTFNEMN